VWYTLQELSKRQFHFPLSNPKGSILKFHLCSDLGVPQIQCRNGMKTPACINVPGVTPASTGKTPIIEQLEPNIPSMGIRLVYEDGDICEVTKVPRKTIIKIPCNQGAVYTSNNWNPQKVWEGKGKEVCHYFVDFPPSKFGCPSELPATSDQSDQLHAEDSVTTFSHQQNYQRTPELPVPELTAVTGCVDSDPARTTRECHFAGKVNLVLHGINFHALCDPATPSSPSISSKCAREFSRQFLVLVGELECAKVSLISQYQINCTVEKGSGVDLDVMIRRRSWSLEELGLTGSQVDQGDYREVEPGGDGGEGSGGVGGVGSGGDGGAGSGGDRGVGSGGDGGAGSGGVGGVGSGGAGFRGAGVDRGVGTGTRGAGSQEEEVANLLGAVSFKEKINYRERFDKFVDMGVGGMKREIDELYRRAFSSRGKHSLPFYPFPLPFSLQTPHFELWKSHLPPPTHTHTLMQALLPSSWNS
jgi:hypothetical protein